MASLGCQVDTALCGDYHSVKWYRQGVRLAVISHDYRWAVSIVRHPVMR